MASPSSLKRTYAEAGLEDVLPAPAPSSPFCALTTPSPTPNSATQDKIFSQNVPASSVSPALMSIPTGTPVSMPNGCVSATGTPITPTQQPTKKSKLTFEEKEIKRIEKEFKDRERAEERARKEAEKAKKEGKKSKKDEEKAKKEAEKEAEKTKREEEKKLREAEKEDRRIKKEETTRLKHEEKAKRDVEKAEKEEEKNKKASSQLRLHQFFNVPSMPISSSANSPTRVGPSPLSSRRSSIAEIHAIEVKDIERRSRSVSATPQKSKQTDYERLFLPWKLKAHMTMAPSNQFSRDKDGLEFVQVKIDQGLKVKAEPTDDPRNGTTIFNMCDLLHTPPHQTHRRPPPLISVKNLVEQLHGTAQNPIDLTDSQFTKVAKKPADQLKTIPLKFLKFREDVRPPYIGTYTRLQDGASIAQLARNPFSRTLPQTDYDYDSEAEWEEPGEGEDLDSEGEEELGDDEDEGEMEEFLDDAEADARAIKRRPLLGDLEPTCTGICWEGPKTPTAKYGDLALDLLMFKLDVLMDNPQLPIDPYSTAYWQPNASVTPLKPAMNAQSNLMDPPRIPLNPIHRQNTLLPLSSAPATSDPSAPMKPKEPPKRLIAPELMDDFKAEVEGNDLTKVGLLEILKKKFPKMPKDAIKETLDLVAERVGPKPSEKKWVLKPSY